MRVMQIATGEIADNPAKEYAHKGGSPENNCAATRISESRRVKHLPPVVGQRTVTLSAETPRGISRVPNGWLLTDFNDQRILDAQFYRLFLQSARFSG